jgi:DNA replicative helicase MCM subunit Mcm2 (Cdc46/Mcm family)
MTDQFEILEWLDQNYQDEEIKISEAHKQFQEDSNYEGKKETFGNLIRKLEKKGLLEKPKRGIYRITDRGESKASFIRNEDIELEEELDQYKKEIKEELILFIEEFKQEEIAGAERNNQKVDFSLSKIDKFNPVIIDYFDSNPDSFQEILEESIQEFTTEDIDFGIDVDVDYYDTTIFKARDVSNLGSFISVNGTVKHSTESFPEVTGAEFRCQECQKTHYKTQDSAELKSPYKCSCGSKRFEPLEKDVINRIDLKLTDREGFAENIKAVRKQDKLDSELKNVLKPGKSIRISGIVREKTKDKGDTRIDPYIEILDFEEDSDNLIDEINQEDIDRVKEKINELENPFLEFARSIKPEIIHRDQLKAVISASLIGAESKKGNVDDDGRIHSLILSNPGMAKSKLLEYVNDTFYDTSLSDGTKSTGPGLIGTTEKDDGKWFFNSGKLVQSNKGILLIDEFDKMDSEHATELNRPMSSGTVEIDKASVNIENLPAYTTIIASGNFSKYVDSDFENLSDYIPDHAKSLMDRFDLKLAIRKESPEKREDVNKAILSKYSDSIEMKDEVEFTEQELIIYHQLTQDINPDMTQRCYNVINKWTKGEIDIANVKGNPEFKESSKRNVDTLAKLTLMFAKSELSGKADSRHAKKSIKLFMSCKNSLGLTDGEGIHKIQEN